MRRTSVFLVVACLLVSFAPLSHAAQTPRPGKKCAQVGAVHAISNGILICARKKNDKKWVKRTWADSVPGSLSGGNPPIDSDSSEESEVFELVYGDIRGRASARNSAPAAFDIRYDPNLPPEKWQKVAQLMSNAYGPWSGLVPMNSPVPLLIMDENSYDWYLSQSDLFPDNNCGASWWMRYGTPTSIQSTGAVCWTPAGNAILLQRVGSGVDPDTNPLTTAHETVHVAQLKMLGNTANEMPCWFGEGQAQVYGAALANDFSMGDIESFREQQTQRLGPFISSRGGSSPAAWAQVLAESENRGSSLCLDNGLGYSMGLLTMEKLYRDFGEDAILNWMQGSRDVGNWKAAFQQRFGVSASEWYGTSAGTYIAEELAK